MMTLFLLMLGAAIPEIEGGALFLAGDQSERAALHDNAAKLFLQCATESDGLRPYALSRAAKNQRLAGRHADAEALFYQVLNDYPDGPWTRLTWMRMGDMRHQQGQVVNARRYYADTLAGLEPLPWFLDKLAWNNADYALALPGYEREGYAYFRSVVADTIYVAPRRDAARRLLTSSNGEDRLWGVYGLARSVNLRDAREAMSKELVVIRGAQGVELPLSSLDIALMAAQADPTGTEQRLETLLHANRECPWARVWLMLAAREQAANKQFSTAEMLARLLSSHFPDGRDAGDAWWYISERCEAADNKAGAQRAYRQLLDRHPDHARAPRALFYLANAARESGQADAAYALYDDLGRLFPEGRFTAEGYYRAAQLAESRKDTEKQTQYLRRAADVGFGHFYAHRALYKLRRTLDGHPPPTRTLRVDGGDNFIDPMPAVLERFEPHHFLITN
ncbi:MAG TPA: tetratricopeptide repeat protein, partial [Candidatus Hydrogenedentes bacterium]|nr:tetratricopeptide repeat protein [Candidatus Hydrogenedentota bacterium]